MSNASGPIDPPRTYPKRALLRGVSEGVVELVPGASLLTNIYRVAYPPREEGERQQWEAAITHRSNAQDEQIKAVVGAFLRLRANHLHAGNAQNLSFVRGGMITTLENIARDGLTRDLRAELQHKLDATADDVQELLEGLSAALDGMSDDENSTEFCQALFDAVFGAFGKSTIRHDISRLLEADTALVDVQKRRAAEICDSIDRLNGSLAKLNTYATSTVSL